MTGRFLSCFECCPLAASQLGRSTTRQPSGGLEDIAVAGFSVWQVDTGNQNAIDGDLYIPAHAPPPPAGRNAALKQLVAGPELRGALEELRGASADLRNVVDRLGARSDALVANLNETVRSTNRLIDHTGQTLATIDRQVGDRSPLLADIRGLVQQVDGAARSTPTRVFDLSPAVASERALADTVD
jgi:hypothetical protein